MAIDNLLRVSVRIDLTVGDMPVAVADLALPAGSSIAEILDEILELTGAPHISRPWVARTAAGAPIDSGLPLSATQVAQGDVIVLSPQRELPAPIIRDVAEALVEHSADHRAGHLLELMTCAGIVGISTLLFSPLAAEINVAARLAMLLGICALLLLWLPTHRTPVLSSALPIALSIGASVASAVFVSTSTGDSSHAVSWILLSVSGTLLVACGVVHLVFRPALLGTATLVTIALHLLVLAGTSALWDRHVLEDFSGPASVTIAVSTIGLSLAPKLAAQLAGVRVPTLPTAGQDLSVSDAPLPEPEKRIKKTKTLFDAQMLGHATVCAPLLLLSTSPGTWVSILFAACVAIASLLHANRHQVAIPVWSLMVVAALGSVSMIVSAAFSPNPSPAWIIFSALVALVLATVGVWVAKIPPLEPTTIVWLERLETLCLAASLPLALHVLDVFGMLRGLDIGLGS
ncbi:hypothetical protein CDES_02985 [Corynebacterium deserti GIMN1.010]|uniref:EccD-like transmembrane domain-containing protein n=1 Tax=Corynebacterium deserti GIMN1.010 TaxID=931089 RepID=A0A0M4CVK8_9CORY|nr:type VII secretion integral membrane protein EccD [Corynebacterium deserti]ALC05050.1 hypothetical protein CDES_02985 [Corynebacterium deserti GIMN1.010]